MNPPQLLQFQVSHYNEKVRWALDFKRWPHRRKTLVPGFHIPTVRRLTGQSKVPAIELESGVFFDSTRILHELERLRPDPPLFPSDPQLLERALALEAFFDDEVAPDLRRLFWEAYLIHPAAAAAVCTAGSGPVAKWVWRAAFPVMRTIFRKAMGVRRAPLQKAHARFSEYFDRLESEIGPSGYLVGDHFTIADLSVAAIMSSIVRPAEFPYPLPEPRPQEFVELRSQVVKRRGFDWVLEIYARHRGTSFEVAA